MASTWYQGNELDRERRMRFELGRRDRKGGGSAGGLSNKEGEWLDVVDPFGLRDPTARFLWMLGEGGLYFVGVVLLQGS